MNEPAVYPDGGKFFILWYEESPSDIAILETLQIRDYDEDGPVWGSDIARFETKENAETYMRNGQWLREIDFKVYNPANVKFIVVNIGEFRNI